MPRRSRRRRSRCLVQPPCRRSPSPGSRPECGSSGSLRSWRRGPAVAALPWIDPGSTHEYWQIYAPFYAILLLILLFPALYVVIVFLCLMHVVYAAVRDELRIRREERRYRCAVLS